MITHSSYGRFDEEIALVEEFQPDLVITALGGAHRVTAQVHNYGGMVFADVISPTLHAKRLTKVRMVWSWFVPGQGAILGHMPCCPLLMRSVVSLTGP